MVPSRTRPLLLALAVAAAAALPATAHAAVSVTGVQLQPSTTAAAAHPDVTIDTTFSEDPSSDDVKSIRLVLPQGLVGNPGAADQCSQASFNADSCPAGSKVGTAQLTAVVTVPPGIDTTQTSPGDIYALVPQGSEPARLGLVVRPPPIGPFSVPKLFLQGPITIGPDTNYGLSSVFDNIPRTAGSFDIRITESKLTLNGNAAHGAFLTNPTNCRPAGMTVTATPYDAGGPSTGSASFTPSDCDKVPFGPHLSGTLGGPGLTAKKASPILSSLIAVDQGQSNVSSVKVVLPGLVGANLTQLSRECAVDAFAAGNCPSGSRVGSVTATSPLLPAPLQGSLLLLANPNNLLPRLAIVLGGNVPLTLVGDVGLENGRVTNSFTGLPDLPLSTFQITVDGGSGLLMNASDLCAPGAGPRLDGIIASQSGRSASVSAPLSVLGCVPGSASAVAKPRASMSVRFGRHGGILTAHLKAGRGAPPIDRVRIVLPPGLAGKKHGAKVSASRKIGGKSLKVHQRRLDMDLGAKGASSISLRWRGLKVGRALRPLLAKRKKVPFTARITDGAKHTTKVTLLVRPSVAHK